MRNPCSLPSRQRGSVIVFAALGLSLAVILLSIADIGFVYYYKREYQKAADLAAIAGAKSLINASGVRSCSGGATPAAQASATQNLGGKTHTLGVDCGRWRPSSTPRFDTTGADNLDDAVQAVISGSPPRFLPFVPATTLSATAIALADQPVAQLKIRSTLATLNDGVVNAILSGLLGGNAAVNVVGWQGVANADINILQFMNNILGITVDTDIGTYQSLLDASDVTLGQVLNAAVAAVGSGSTAGATLQAFQGQLAAVGVNVNTLTVPLGDLLALQTGAQTAGLNAAVNALDLIRAVVEIANREHAIAATAPINIPGVAGVSVRATVIEQPQPSEIGNPALLVGASNAKTDLNRIYVRTGQVRILVSTNLAAIGLINQLTNILAPLFSVSVLDSQLDIAIQVGGAEGWVTGYSCTSGSKSLTASSASALANASIGKLTAAQQTAVFSSTASFPTASPLNILTLKLLGVTVAQVELAAKNLPVGQSSTKSFTYPCASCSTTNGLPEVGVETAEMYQTLSAQNIVGGLTAAIDTLQLTVAILPGLGLLTATVNALLSGVTALVGALVGSVLSPILDPVINNLLTALGLNLASADLGAALSCNGGGAVLVD